MATEKERRDNLEATLRLYQELNNEIKEEMKSKKGLRDAEAQLRLLREESANNQRMINELMKNASVLTEEQKNDLKEILSRQRAIVDEEKKYNKQLKDGNAFVKARVGFFRELNRELKIGWQYLQQSDKIIRQTILSLGMSGAKAEMMRQSFEQSAGYVARLGGSMEDIRDIMTTFADRTGRARVLTGEMVEQVTQIGKGTGLGVEQATLLAAQFEYMGVNVAETMEYVQGVVDTSERMGVNTTKVLRNINDNFKKLNTYTFRQGVSGLAEMATYAEKFRVDITQALSAADVARSLEGAIDLAAQLQIMGGEFAKTDPFEMLFLSRNDPAEFTKKISEMTRGVVSFRKMADGSFEKFISPADRDRLRNVAQSLGMSVEEITEIAQRRAEMDKMAGQMQGMGLSTREKELVEGAATFDSKSGRFMVQVGTQMKDITSMNSSQVKLLASEISTLEERAKAAQTFEDVLKATIEELKAGLLPVLRGINKALSTIRPVIEAIVDWTKGADTVFGKVLRIGGVFMLAAGVWKGVGALWTGITNKLSGVAGKFFGGGRTGAGGGSGILSRVSGGIAPGQPGSMFTKTGMIRKGAGGLTMAKGGASALKGVGMGAAMVGAGAGINIAAQGINKLADGMSRLTPEQAKSLQNIVISLTAMVAISGGLAVGIAALGGASTGAALGLLAFGAAMVGVGFGINLATKGIAIMADSLTRLVEAGADAGPTFRDVGAGIGMITASMIGLSFSGGIGIAKFAALLKVLRKNEESITVMGNSFTNIGEGLKSLPNIIPMVEAINTIDSTGLKNVGTSLSGVLKRFSEIREHINAIKGENITNEISFTGLEKVNTMLSGTVEHFKSVKNAIESISKVTISKDGAISELTNLLKTPLKVEFTDKQVALVSNITLEIDGQKFHQATKTGAYIRNNYNDSKSGKEGNG